MGYDSFEESLDDKIISLSASQLETNNFKNRVKTVIREYLAEREQMANDHYSLKINNEELMREINWQKNEIEELKQNANNSLYSGLKQENESLKKQNAELLRLFKEDEARRVQEAKGKIKSDSIYFLICLFRFDYESSICYKFATFDTLALAEKERERIIRGLDLRKVEGRQTIFHNKNNKTINVCGYRFEFANISIEEFKVNELINLEDLEFESEEKTEQREKEEELSRQKIKEEILQETKEEWARETRRC